MNTRRVMTWVIFWSSVALALGALAWVSIEVVALEKRETRSTLNASRQEDIRRALWRMDSRMAPILAIEAARPYNDYRDLEHNPAPWLEGAKANDLASTNTSNQGLSYAKQYFQFSDSTQPAEFVGRISQLLEATSDTDQDPTHHPPSGGLGIAGDFAQKLGKASEDQAPNATKESRASESDYEARKRVAELATQSAIDPSDESSSPIPSAMDAESDADLKSARDDSAPDSALGNAQGFTLEHIEAQDAIKAIDLSDQPQADGVASTPDPVTTSIPAQPVATLVPRWIEDAAGTMQLVLVRSVTIDNQPMIQGVWLDWPTLRSDLLESVNDVMPGATLVPVDGPRSAMVGGYQLATIPVEFIPPQSQLAAPWRWSPATVGLLVTWIAIIATIIAVGVVLRAAIVLSERRGRFVSAVTHELRTPLTTFRLYSQMLADGMVSDEQVRTDYLHILKRESERLTGIVENVLEYARLTRQRPTKGKPAGVQTLSPGALVARFRPALARRAGQSNLDLVVSLDLDTDQDRTLTVDPHAVERIMMNLIENSCKYAAPSEDEDSAIEDIDTRIHFDVSIRRNTLELLIADHGPGIPQSESAQIFGEFQRGWRGLSNARSGLGLGLALSRGLAREMGGDLILTHRRNHGAEFLLTIPLDEHPA